MLPKKDEFEPPGSWLCPVSAPGLQATGNSNYLQQRAYTTSSLHPA
jgi:hypothetical protein